MQSPFSLLLITIFSSCDIFSCFNSYFSTPVIIVAIMSFWSIARACVHQAQECTTHQHFYPDEVETHLARLGTLSELLAEFRCSPAIPEETVCELLAWEEEVSRLSMILQQEAESTDQQE